MPLTNYGERICVRLQLGQLTKELPVCVTKMLRIVICIMRVRKVVNEARFFFTLCKTLQFYPIPIKILFMQNIYIELLVEFTNIQLFII